MTELFLLLCRPTSLTHFTGPLDKPQKHSILTGPEMGLGHWILLLWGVGGGGDQLLCTQRETQCMKKIPWEEGPVSVSTRIQVEGRNHVND